MKFFGRPHPIFSSFIESENISSFEECSTLTHRSQYTQLQGHNKGAVFFHSEPPVLPPNLDIEYVFNIEDQMTLYNSVHNGHTHNLDFHNHPETGYIRQVLEDDRCKKIICHMEQMAEALPNLLKSDIIKNKTQFQRIGIPCVNKKDKNSKEQNFTILFTNSFANWNGSFYLRGGHFILQAFLKLIKKYPNINLILRSSIPNDIHIPNIPNIKVIPKFISEDQLDELYTMSDIYVLPACRIHSHSICKAFSHGLPTITTNGWGIEEYVAHEYNGLVIKGFEKVSWNDENFGCIENYDVVRRDGPLNESTVNQLYNYLEFVINNPKYLRGLEENCEAICETTYSLDNWNNWKI